MTKTTSQQDFYESDRRGIPRRVSPYKRAGKTQSHDDWQDEYSEELSIQKEVQDYVKERKE